MVDIFSIQDGIAYPTTEALLLSPFKLIWERDEDKHKSDAINIFTYIHLLCNPRKSNPFFDIDEKLRASRVKQEVWGDPNFDHPDYLLIIDAVYKYNKLLEIEIPSLKLYKAALKAHDELVDFLNVVSLNERTAAGGAVYKPADISRAFKELPDIKKTLDMLKNSVYEEIEESAKTRNSREIGEFER